MNHPIQIIQHIVVPKPHYMEALLIQKETTPLVIRLLIHVLSTIQLDDHPLFPANKISDIRPDGILTSEFVPRQLPIAQHLP
jgi:hypothetical protein